MDLNIQQLNYNSDDDLNMDDNNRDLEYGEQNIRSDSSSRFIPTMNIITPQSPRTLSNQETINGWTPESIKTLEIWKQKLIKTSYIYDYVLEKYKSRQDLLLIIIAIMGGLSSLLGSISSALIVPTNTEQDNNTTNTGASSYYWVIFGLMICVSLCSSIVALLSYIIKLKQWTPYCQTISECINKVDDLYTVFENQSILPYSERDNASTFIQKYNVEFINTINLLPNITPSDYEEANNEYIRNAYSPTNIKTDLKLN